ncbi:type II toxin-antitoxin system HicA family toxin [Clostridium kluyveri]|uniref:YcfA-like protein n=1 Tax=Clostridium kluyveri TaxID=1534 RepID=A0A1L5F463_CLOKL|nr:type II toxin-antitoxin system HicA family toxin [Clostridium kluyveri]APM37796.1 hypothetical protein BS101_03070 [Clostridium kluyveri]
MNREEMELMIMNAFKIQERIVEDFMMTDVNDELVKLADSKANERYEKIKDISNKMKNRLLKVNNLHDFSNFFNDYVKYQNNFVNLVDKYMDYFHKEYFEAEIFETEILKVIKEKVVPETDKLNALIIIAQLSNMNKFANILKFRMKKLTDNIEFICKECVKPTLHIYRVLVENLIRDIQKLEKERIELLKTLTLDAKVDISKEYKKDIYKIFNYKDMNRLLEINGYEEDRQTGDHKIYKSKDGKKSIPVPQRSLGKSLSFKIQKQIG